MVRNDLITALKAYQTPYPGESAFVPRFLSLLQNFNSCYSRALVSGHMTASAFITNANRDSVLLVHHKKLNRWLQPGGHADGDENVMKVAMKEAAEETGIRDLQLLQPTFFDIDIHQIPRRGSEPAHFHYDIRFAFVTASMNGVEKNHESYEIDWIPVDNIGLVVGQNQSILRMCEKLNSLPDR